MKIKCSNCGNILDETDSKCIMCGYDINTIKFQNKEELLIKKGKIKKPKKKTVIVLLEILAFLIIAVVYIKLFIPSILEITEENNKIRNISNCEHQDGIWENGTCNYDY